MNNHKQGSEIMDFSGHSGRLFSGDCLNLMRNWDDETIDLIYLDPPFCTGKDWVAFNDKWGKYHGCKYIWVEQAHSTEMASFIAYMAMRLAEMHRLLKPTGSLYLHCDPTASHYLKVVLDRVFGKGNIGNEVKWHYPNRLSQKGFPFPKMHDVCLLYTSPSPRDS